MMKTIKGTFLLMLLIAFQSCEQKEIEKVDFLQGTWQIEGKQNFESWKMVGSEMIGEAYKTNGSERHVSETLEIKAEGEKLIYTATVKNQNQGKGIEFILQPVKDQLYSFENPEHDFPNKIQYKILSKTELQVSVLGKDGKGFSYKMIKQ